MHVTHLIRTGVAGLLLMVLAACSADREKNEDSGQDLEALLNEIVPEEQTPAFITIDSSGYYEIELPGHMIAMPNLNEEAHLEYGYAAESGGQVLEHYVIVMMETKEEIEGYDLHMEFDARSYSEVVVNSLVETFTSYEILNGNPQVEQKNGMDCVVIEISAALGQVEIYYKMGVFEGEKAFYQVLTWTLLTQRETFAADMDHILGSFREIQ